VGKRFTVRRLKPLLVWKGCLDKQRHHDKLNEALLSGDKKRISREVLVVPGEDSHVRIPLLFLDEYGFEYEAGERVFIGHWLEARGEKSCGPLVSSPGPGETVMPGVLEGYPDAFLNEAVDPGWVLPGMEDHPGGEKPSLRGTGGSSLLDARRTLLANLKRNALQGTPCIGDFRLEDIKHRQDMPGGEARPVPVMFLVKDVSDSMEDLQREVCSRVFTKITGFIRQRYRYAVIVYLIHHVGAREVGMREFFALSRCGGTACSSAYEKLLEIIRARYRSSHYRCFGFHVSDGKNLHADNLECRRLLKEILPLTCKFAYLQTAGEREEDESLLGASLRCLKSSTFLLTEALTPEGVDPVLGMFFAGT